MRVAATLLLLSCACQADVVVFWQDGFPSVDSQPLRRQTLEEALPSPVFKSLDELRQPDSLKGADLLVLPYGSAFPAEAWTEIEKHLTSGGNLLVLGGRPLFVPVRREQGEFTAGRPQNSYARRLGLWHFYEAPQKDFARFAWDEGVSYLPAVDVGAARVFVGTAASGLGYLLDAGGERAAAPVTKLDYFRTDSTMFGARCVFLNFEPAPDYWSSPGGVLLIRSAARYASLGTEWLRLEMASAALSEGEIPRVIAQLGNARKQRRGEPLKGTIRLELLAGTQPLGTAEVPCSGDMVAESATFDRKLGPGLYTVRGTYLEGDQPREVYTTGFWVRDRTLLESGMRLGVAGDYFSLDGAPYLPVGTSYFTTDPYSGWFEGSGNAYGWDRDFAEMERAGVTFVRTGIWAGNADYAERMTGAATERFLRTIEAYLLSAARHHMQVHFTFFAFDPQTTRRDSGQELVQLGPGSNPYTDPVAIRAQRNWVVSIVRRFRDVPFLSWDLINEPSFSNPRRPWRTVPNGDPTEMAAWNRWLEQRYGSIEKLADAWGLPADQLQVGSVPLPSDDQLEARRSGVPDQVRALDYNLFAQDAFNHWVGEMIAAIRTTGSRQLVTVGQDEGGVMARPLTQFYGGAGVDFTVNHSWWQDDALLWDSLAAKRPGKPNLIGETGVQPVWRLDSTWRWDEVASFGLFERKIALGFAAANSGSLHWDWARGETVFGILRADGSNKVWMGALHGIAEFARGAAPYAAGARPPEIAIMLPQSLQLSVFNRYALEAQQKCVRALYHSARASAYAVGEYQIDLLGDPKLIILPSPWMLSQNAWEAILAKVRAGAVLLVSGRFDADEHFRPQPRAEALGIPYRPAFLSARENPIRWAGHESSLSYSGDKTTFVESGSLEGGATYIEKPFGRGTILYFTLPLELSDNLDVVGEIYRFAIGRAGITPAYTTAVTDPGILICPTRLEKATLYVLTSESGTPAAVAFRDQLSGKELTTTLEPGRAVLVMVRADGAIAAAYNFR